MVLQTDRDEEPVISYLFAVFIFQIKTCRSLGALLAYDVNNIYRTDLYIRWKSMTWSAFMMSCIVIMVQFTAPSYVYILVIIPLFA